MESSTQCAVGRRVKLKPLLKALIILGFSLAKPFNWASSKEISNYLFTTGISS